MSNKKNMLYLHIMKKEAIYSAPNAELCWYREDSLLCYSPEGDNEDYSIDEFNW